MIFIGRRKRRRARVIYSYTPVCDDELELEVDDVVEVLNEVEEGWWMGSVNGKKGVFPSNFVVEQAEEAKPRKTENHYNANVKSSGMYYAKISHFF